MAWFTKDNDDDIDDIYNKLDDIYDRLEALDVVNAFSARLSRLEKTSAYLESVLMESVKELEKRVDGLSNTNTDSTTPTTDTSTLDSIQSQIDSLMDDIDTLKGCVPVPTDTTTTPDTPVPTADSHRLDDMDDTIKNLMLKVSYLELSKDRTTTNSSEELSKLREELSQKDEQIAQLNKKIESLTYIIEEDSRNIKMVAKHIIDQANSMKSLREEVYQLTSQTSKDNL